MTLTEIYPDRCTRRSAPVVNPATEAVIDDVPYASRQQFDEAVVAARHAFMSWSQDELNRRAALRTCAEILKKRTNSFELAALLTQEQGKPKREALNEVYSAAHWFAAMAEMEIPSDSRRSQTGKAEIRHEPLGIVGAITAWNYPVFLAASKIASALRAGNVVLLKPSPYTPLSTIRLAEMLTQSDTGDGGPLPQEVVTVLTGDQELGKWLVESPDVAHVSFTGSTDVGKRIWENSAKTFKPMTLELGGNDAAIVLGDADVEQLIERLFWAAFTNAGQFCAGVKRLYVQEPVYELVVREFAQLARTVIVGAGSHPKTQMGPLSHEPQFNRIIELVERTKENGALIVAGGEPVSGPGYFYPPTVVTNVTEGDPLVDGEQFGPVFPILPFRHIDEAISRANATQFGLGGSVWTRDEGLAAGIASQLECGTVWINQHGVLDPMVPFGGHKLSGMGSENGWEGVCEFTKMKVVHYAHKS